MKKLNKICLRFGLFFALLALVTGLARGAPFEVSIKSGISTNFLDGRLVVLVSLTNRPEPRLNLDDADSYGPFAFGRDALKFGPGQSLVIDDSATSSVNHKASRIPPGRYFVQAVLDASTDLHYLNSGGNLVSDVKEVRITADQTPIKLELSKKLSDDLPAETEYVKFIKIQSRLLSEFHGRPIYLRAGIILPRGYATTPETKYPLWINIGGYGTRYTDVARRMRPDSRFRPAWTAADAPPMIYVVPDGAGPYGDPYQINSANNGPYGDALVQELIPAIEKQFRAIGEPRARVLGGTSTGAWVALALQIFYPDSFNGAWVSSPDPVDFRAFELVNIYEDDNAYVNRHGEERPSIRDLSGDVQTSMRREVQMEAVLARGGDWTLSGGQWGAWNAVYGPRGAEGKPTPLWDSNGKINRAAAEHWKKYDLRLVLESRWSELSPKLRGKLHIWAGDADEYFLNNAVLLLSEWLSDRADGKGFAEISFGVGQGHGWMGINVRELMKRIYASTQNPKNN
jgi:S-formylglutathione hydrolase FrmB